MPPWQPIPTSQKASLQAWKCLYPNTSLRDLREWFEAEYNHALLSGLISDILSSKFSLLDDDLLPSWDSQTARALANSSFETPNETQSETQSCLRQSSNNIFPESASPSATIAFEELCHDRFQIPDLDPGFCNLFQEDQQNEPLGGRNMPQEYQFRTQPSHNLSRRHIMICVYEFWLLCPTSAKCF